MAEVPQAPASSGDAADRRDRLRQVDELLPVVYEELHRLAGALLQRCQPVNATCTTSLIHDVYMRLAQRGTPFKNRSHFLCLAARAMRFVLIDRARRAGAAKRGGDLARTLDEALVPAIDDATLVDLDQALTRLASFDERKSRVVELRFFGALSVEDTAEAIGLSPATVKREWTLARAWLFREISDGLRQTAEKPR
jgi:RNA polymerase sigma factor (TIGR02999 family)